MSFKFQLYIHWIAVITRACSVVAIVLVSNDSYNSNRKQKR